MTRLEDELSGEGARIFGGRWNSPGHACLYCAASLELALLETLVHLDLDLIPADVLAIELDVPDQDVAHPSVVLPEDWDAPPPYSSAAQQIGDAWLQSRSSVACALPSSVLPLRSNVLMNPEHPSFAQVRIVERKPMQWPRRLLAHLGSLRMS